MKLNDSKLRLLELIAQKNEANLRDIPFLSTSLKSTYLNELLNEGFLEKKGKKFMISHNRFARILSNLLNEQPNFAEFLKNEGIPILMSIANPENDTIPEIAHSLGLKESSVYPYIRKFVGRQIIYRENNHIRANKLLWNELFHFIELYRSYYVQEQFNKLPNNAKIYFESPYEVIFSLPSEFDEASKTAFSTYDSFGIKLRDREEYYRFDELPKRKLDQKTILLDSLRIAGAENEESVRRRTYCYLFYKKNIAHFKKIKHPDLEILKDIVKAKGELKQQMFPTYNELVEKGENYDIKI